MELSASTALATSLANPTSLPPMERNSRSILRARSASHFFSTRPPFRSGTFSFMW